MSPSRQPFVVGNWKMNGTGASLAELASIASAVIEGAAGRAEVAICPPATLISRAVALVEGRLAIGGQDCAVAAQGAHTGDIAAEMLAEAGARLVIVGHSERRSDHGEDDALVRAKAEAALRAGLTAVVCVGESEAERDAGNAHAIVGAQVLGSVPQGAAPGRLVVAYEPVWAIGTGRTPTEADVAAMHGVVRRRLAEALGPEVAASMRILYGGSVKPANAAALMAVADVDGALIGGASLKAADFLAIAGVYR